MEYQEYDFAPLPKGLSGYPHQIAGHGLVDIKSACGKTTSLHEFLHRCLLHLFQM